MSDERMLIGADVRQAEEAWDELSMREANLWASKWAFMAVWLTENVLDPTAPKEGEQ